MRVYCPEARSGKRVQLAGAPCEHLRVMRVALGDSLLVFDGCGNEFVATVIVIEQARRRIHKMEIEVGAAVATPLPEALLPQVHLMQAQVSGPKCELIVRMGCELGISSCSFFPTENTKSCTGPTPKLQDRVAQIAISASEQCGRRYLPKIKYYPDLTSAIAALDTLAAPMVLALDPAGEKSLPEVASAAQARPLVLFVGPESGFSPAEVEFFLRRQVQLTTMGPLVLRCEHAAFAALAMAIALNKH